MIALPYWAKVAGVGLLALVLAYWLVALDDAPGDPFWPWQRWR